MRAVLREVERGHHDNPRNTYRDGTILLVALWAALHDKPVSWATVPAHWPADLRPRGRAGRRGLPSQSRMSRRLRVACGCDADPAANAADCRPMIYDLLERWQAALRRQLPDTDVKLIDGRGLVIGGCSKDPDAGFGYTAGTKAKGYKLHWAVDQVSGAVDGWLVAPMNYPEPEAARHLIAHLPPHARYMLGDNNYDRNDLYEQAGTAGGGGRGGVQWVAPPRRNAKGLGHCRHSDWRRAVQPWLRTAEGRRKAAAARLLVEHVNGRLGCAAVGLDHLPYHARRLHRVTVWVALKVLILTDLQAATWHRACA
jgi:hypothetical protein